MDITIEQLSEMLSRMGLLSESNIASVCGKLSESGDAVTADRSEERGQGAPAEAGGRQRMQVSYKVRSRQSPWPRVMRCGRQPAERSVHRGTTGLCIELRGV